MKTSAASLEASGAMLPVMLRSASEHHDTIS
jgi:hypothetical protein